jgi:hypothetical protein
MAQEPAIDVGLTGTTRLENRVLEWRPGASSVSFWLKAKRSASPSRV